MTNITDILTSPHIDNETLKLHVLLEMDSSGLLSITSAEAEYQSHEHHTVSLKGRLRTLIYNFIYLRKQKNSISLM
jgi:hypothetical protein